MFAINHAAAALVFKRRFDAVPMIWLLIAVQLSEMLWVVFNLAGLERTTTNDTLHTVGDIHLEFLPYSHSILGSMALALIAGLLAARVLRGARAGLAVGLALLSHIVLDLVTHARDLPLAPWGGPRFGLGLYDHAPLVAFFVELAFGVACWWIYRGSRGLLAAIVGFNLLNLPLFVPGIAGPKPLLVHHPTLIVCVIGLQIAVTLAVVGVLARRGAGNRLAFDVPRAAGSRT